MNSHLIDILILGSSLVAIFITILSLVFYENENLDELTIIGKLLCVPAMALIKSETVIGYLLAKIVYKNPEKRRK